MKNYELRMKKEQPGARKPDSDERGGEKESKKIGKNFIAEGVWRGHNASFNLVRGTFTISERTFDGTDFRGVN